jgi:hypothetical protein
MWCKRFGIMLAVATALLGAVPADAQAAAGDFQYRKADGNWDALSDPPNDSCRWLSGGAQSVVNRTDTTATLYTDVVCSDARKLATVTSGGSWDTGGSLRTAQTVKFG